MIDRVKIDRTNSTYLIVDMQTKLAEAMDREVLSTVAFNINLVISALKILSVPILITEQYRKGLGNTLESIVNNLGDEFKPFEKMSFSAWGELQFQSKLQSLNRKYVIISGMESHVCVLQTALDLIDRGYTTHIISDATCSRYKSDWDCAMNYLRDAGAVISTTEILVFQLLQQAGTDEFKAISPMFKNRNRI
jgi:nicotinamidase-related amidase